MQRIGVIDTHTGGEPTRVVMSGGPDLGSGTMMERRQRFAEQFDDWRRAMTCEPRGSECMVGALITEPERAGSLCGVIFFNNVGYLNMCGHGTIGIAVALAHVGRVGPGNHTVDTPVGPVRFELLAGGKVRIQNVPSYRYRAGVTVDLVREVSGISQVCGDIAWGGNWFFLCEDKHLSIELSNLELLHQLSTTIRQSLVKHGINGEDSGEIDHIELVGLPLPGEATDARNFVLCPGGEYDRSPCGTGTSAKVACLAAAGKLQPGQVWRQSSVIGSQFEASYAVLSTDPQSGQPVEVSVTLEGSAYVNAEADLVLDPNDPFCMGFR